MDAQTRRSSTGLAGGVGCSHQELCGALSGGVLLIGALHGRTQPSEDDSLCHKLAAEYRRRFGQEFGATICRDLRAGGYGSAGKAPCAVLVERAAGILLDLVGHEPERAD